MSAVGPADRNLEILSVIARAIGPLRETVVFVGGCATGLLVTNVRAQPIPLVRLVSNRPRFGTFLGTACAFMERECGRRVVR
jgi:hypothetical protein